MDYYYYRDFSQAKAQVEGSPTVLGAHIASNQAIAGNIALNNVINAEHTMKRK